MRQASRRVLITGAGSGLGRALAFRYAEAGWRVACADIRLERAEETVALITGFGIGAMALHVDVGDDDSFEGLRDLVLAAWEGVDLVINNAGVAASGSALTTPIDDWRWMLEINLLGVVRGCRLFGPVLTEQAEGRIVNIASFAGLAGPPGMVAYATAKAAVVAFSESLRAELHGSGVGVSVVCPSFFQTNLLENFRAADPRGLETARTLMRDAKESPTDIADAVYRGVARGEFLILPTAVVRKAWRLKRWWPERFFRVLMQRVQGR
ncbi:SDR family oxidoreductase [Dokdonella sp. MW10]|uniref:SDR family oxidoreductase n=1 Tax=Dokdonella sp. MW10 TaxID=2992926 RepID=UPI003F7E1957